MKAFLYMTTFAFCLMFTQYGNAADAPQSAPNMAPRAPAGAPAQNAPRGQKPDHQQYQNQPQRAPNAAQCNACPEDHPCEDQPMGECWCLMVHYEPRYYTTQRCVEEQVPCTKKCWRKVPEQYEVQRCKMVPEYYTETCTRYRDECYDVQETKCCKKWVCDEHCEYVPCYYWKHVCGNPECPQKDQVRK